MRPFSPEESVLAMLSSAGLLADGWAAWAPSGPAIHGVPDTILLNGGQLAMLRETIRRGGPDAQEMSESATALALAALEIPAGSVIDKHHPAPSGSAHDYVSLAKYWWPDEERPDGLPYVRRDGQVNPECFSDAYDVVRLGAFADGVLALAVCGYLLGERDWLDAARERIDRWLVAPETRQSPHFTYAQQVPGRASARGAATIEARRLAYVCDAVRILEVEGALDAADREALQLWYSDLLGWLQGSAIGRAAAEADNNISVWYHLQLLVFAEFTGNRDVTARVARRAAEIIRTQVQPDGSMPAEAVRQNPVDYLAFGYVGFAMLARVASRSGVDLWDTSAADGRGLSAAHDWLVSLSRTPPGPAAGPVPDPEADTEWEGARQRLALRIAALQQEMLEARDETIRRLSDEVETLLQAVPATSGPAQATAPARPGRAASSRFTPGRIGRGARRRLQGTLAHRALRRVIRERPPAAVSAPAPALQARMLEEYRAKGLDRAPHSFVLYRILGNDLPPRHDSGQTIANVRFILEHEPALPDCQKRWIVNRIADPAVEAAVVRLLAENDQPHTVIPFVAEDYGQQPFALDDFPSTDYLESGLLDALVPEQRERALVAAFRHKNRYAMNNNGARNLALEQGRELATWILPFDGSTFFTTEAWAAFVDAVASRPEASYVVVPMARVVHNASLLESGSTFPVGEEPQLAFRRDAVERFDERRPYGRRPKVDLFWRLGIPGPWERWSLDPWDLPFPEPSPDRGRFVTGGWVARLGSGVAEAEVPGLTGLRDRGFLRQAAIIDFLRSLDATSTRSALAASPLSFYDDAALTALAGGRGPALRAAVVAEAEGALLRGPYAVTDSSSLPPSGSAHDYWHPAPYWWPHGRGDGTPYVWRDGVRRPGTQMYSPASEQFDRTRLHGMLHDTTALALGWAVTGDDRYAGHGARLVRTWFLDGGTAMTPHLEFAQVRLGHDGNRGQATGLIEMKDLYYFLDAVRLLTRAGALSEADARSFRTWLRAYFTWFLESPQGTQERRAANNHGTCYDLQSLAIAAYLGDADEFNEAVRRATGRLGAQFDPTGAQPEELRRAETRHYCAFNLQSWLNAARIAECGGAGLWDAGFGTGSLLSHGIDWYLAVDTGEGWPYPQVQEFDTRRDLPIRAARRLMGEPETARRGAWTIPSLSSAPAVLHPHDGTAPFWQLSCGPRGRGAGEHAAGDGS